MLSYAYNILDAIELPSVRRENVKLFYQFFSLFMNYFLLKEFYSLVVLYAALKIILLLPFLNAIGQYRCYVQMLCTDVMTVSIA